MGRLLQDIGVLDAFCVVGQSRFTEASTRSEHPLSRPTGEGRGEGAVEHDVR